MLKSRNFGKYKLRGLQAYHNSCIYAIIREAFPDIKPWEMIKAPRHYDIKENRIAAVKWLVERLGKDPRYITINDFVENGLRVILNYKRHYEALQEAGLITKEDMEYMRRRGGIRFNDIPSPKEAREAARKLARNAEKKLPKRMVKGRRTPRTS